MMTANRDDSVTLRLRLDGDDAQIAPFLDRVRAMDHVDRVVEVGTRADHLRDDSSSAGLAEASERMDFHNIEIRALNQDAADNIHDLAETAARELGLAVEFLERF